MDKKNFLKLRVEEFTKNEFKERCREQKFPLIISYSKTSYDEFMNRAISQKLKINKIEHGVKEFKDYKSLSEFIDNLNKKGIGILWFKGEQPYRVEKNSFSRLIVPASSCVR